MYSDEWLKQGFNSSLRMKVSDEVDYRIWLGNDGTAVGVTVDFETADDFHYELLMPDWNRFLAEDLHDTNPAYTTKVFGEYLHNCKGLFSFEEDLNSNGIKYEKLAFY